VVTGEMSVTYAVRPQPGPALPVAPPAPRRRLLRADVLAVGSYLAGALLLCGRLLAHPGQRLPYTSGDRTLFEYFLAFAARVVTHGADPFFIDQLNAPLGVNAMANTTILGLGLPLAPVTIAFGPAVSFDVLIVLGLAATATAWYGLLARHLVTRRPAAWVGGLVAGFAPSVANHATSHPNLTAQFLVPLLAWQVVRLRNGVRWGRTGLTLAALVIWQVFINEETLLIAALAIGLFGALHVAQRRRVHMRQSLAGLGLAAAASGAVLAYPLWWQFCGRGAYRGGDPFMTAFHTDLLGETSFSRNSVAVQLSEFQPPPSYFAEQHGYFGWPLVVLVAMIVVWRRREVLVRCLALTGATFAVLSFGGRLTLGGHHLGVPGPYALLDHLPLFDTLLPTRLGEVTTWTVAPLVALGIQRLGELHPHRALTVAAFTAALLPAAPMPIQVVVRPPVPPYITSGAWRAAVQPGESVLIAPLPDWDHDTAMRWAAATGLDMRISHGYFLGPAGGVDGRHAVAGPARRPTDDLLERATEAHDVPAVNDLDRQQARADFAYWRTGLILVPDGAAAAAERAVITELVGPGRHVGGLWAWDL
jgi:hypothetical protein